MIIDWSSEDGAMVHVYTIAKCMSTTSHYVVVFKLHRRTWIAPRRDGYHETSSAHRSYSKPCSLHRQSPPNSWVTTAI